MRSLLTWGFADIPSLIGDTSAHSFLVWYLFCEILLYTWISDDPAIVSGNAQVVSSTNSAETCEEVCSADGHLDSFHCGCYCDEI